MAGRRKPHRGGTRRVAGAGSDSLFKELRRHDFAFERRDLSESGKKLSPKNQSAHGNTCNTPRRMDSPMLSD
jgi:hypothetical protein